VPSLFPAFSLFRFVLAPPVVSSRIPFLGPGVQRARNTACRRGEGGARGDPGRPSRPSLSCAWTFSLCLGFFYFIFSLREGGGGGGAGR
jgi:hypothetical protein